MTNPINPIDTVKALVDALDDVITQVRYYEQGTSAIIAGRALLAQMQSQPSDERKAAEHEYACTAFDYPSAPVGSRDWTLFWKGWQAARALGPVKAQQEPAAWMHKGGMKVMPADEKAAYEQAPDDFSREIAAEYSTPLYTTAARTLGPVKAQQEPQGKVQLPDKARAGIEELHRVVESLLTTSRYVDEEGEATQALADLSDCIADPPFRLAAHQGAQPAVPSDIADGIKGPHNACMFREHCRSLLAAAPSMTGTDHHYTAENVRSILARLRRFASGSHESAEEFANLDWRGWSNVLWRVMSALAAEVPCPAQEPQGEAQPVARYTVEKQSGSEWARVVDRQTGAQVARYSVMPRKRSQRDGWKDAERHAARLNAAIAAQPASRGPQGEAQQPVSPQMQFTLIDAANTLKHAAEQATPDVAAAYKARAAEVFSVVASLAAQQPESRKPLTDEEVEPLFRQIKAMPITPGGIKDEWFWFAWGVEMGERAHGIGTGASKEVNDAA
jgi:hypothetical protein